MLHVIFVSLVQSIAPTVDATGGFDAAGLQPLKYSVLMDNWPSLLRQGRYLESLESVKHLHIPFAEPIPNQLAEKISSAVPDLLKAIVDGGPKSGHPYEPMLYDESLKIQKASCEGAQAVFKKVPGLQGGDKIGGKRMKDIIRPAGGYAADYRGFSTVVMDMNYYSKAAGLACTFLQKFHGAPQCYSNWYISPVGSCTYQPHLDLEENFVVQLAGAKTWRIYNTTGLFPMLDLCHNVDECSEVDALEAAQATAEAGAENVVEVRMRPGDLLYLPRGVIHEAESEQEVSGFGSYSSHVTFAVMHGMTWTQLLIDMLADRQQQNKSFRDDVQSPACRGLASDMVVHVDAGAAIGTQPKAHACPAWFAQLQLPWAALCFSVFPFAARKHVSLRRMLRIADKDRLESGLKSSFATVRNVLHPTDIAPKQMMMELLDFAAGKGLLGPKATSGFVVGSKNGGWLKRLHSGLCERLEFLFMGGLTGRAEPNWLRLIKTASRLMKKSAKRGRQQSESYDRERKEELLTPYNP